MKSVFSRILLFVLAVPGIFALVIFLPYGNNLAFIIACCIMSGLGTLELSAILKAKGLSFSPPHALVLGLVLIAADIVNSYIRIFGDGFLGIVTALALTAILSGAIIPKEKDNFEHALRDIGGGLLLLVYPGFFMLHVVRLCFLPHGRYLIVFFLLMVFCADAMAYAAGKLFGGKRRLALKVSPHKTLVGFLTIPVTAMGISLAGGVLILDPLILRLPTGPNALRILMYIFIGFVVSCASILGDLAESGFKRSVNIKDSGTIIPGRGGVLDSIDSLLFSAPFFYYLIRLML